MMGLRERPMTLSVRIAIAAIALELCVGANLLTCAGIPYVSEGGPLPLKLHPGSYLLALALCVQAIGGGSAGCWRFLWSEAFLAGFLAAMIICVTYAALMTGPGNLVVLLETFIPAGFAAAVLSQASRQDVTVLRHVLRWGILANSLLAVCEAVLEKNLIPLYLNDAVYEAAQEDFRSTALYDHPLTGSMMTMLGIALAPSRPLVRLPYLAVTTSSLLAFGGRMALAMTILGAVLLACIAFGEKLLRRDRGAVLCLLSFGTAACLLTAIVLAALASGLGARLAGHLYWDQSAQVRLAQWHLLDALDGWQLGFGTERRDQLALLNALRLSYGVGVIENFWLLMLITLGAAGFPIFLAGFVSLLVWCWRRTDLQGRLALAGVILVASTSNSFGRKSTLLVGMVAALCCRPSRHCDNASDSACCAAATPTHLLGGIAK